MPRYECRLDFHQSLYRVMVAGEEPPVFKDSSNDDNDAQDEDDTPVDDQDTPPVE